MAGAVTQMGRKLMICSSVIVGRRDGETLLAFMTRHNYNLKRLIGSMILRLHPRNGNLSLDTVFIF